MLPFRSLYHHALKYPPLYKGGYLYGESRIRTRGAVTPTAFRVPHHRPLGHLSAILNYALGRNRTADALLRTEALYPLSYEGIVKIQFWNINRLKLNMPCLLPAARAQTTFIVRSKGLEPPAYRSATCRSIQLSYERKSIQDVCTARLPYCTGLIVI